MRYTRIECEERNASRLLNTFLDKKVRIKNLKSKDGKLTFCIDDKNLKTVTQVLSAQRMEYRVLKRGGTYLAKKTALRYLSLVICALIAVTGICLGTKVCLGVEIECADGTQRAQIMQILDEFGYKKYSRKTSLDTKALSYAITSEVDDIGFANCYFEGGILKIEVQNVHSDEAPESYSRIVASCDGIITRVLVYSGTALVKAGDVVKRGQTIATMGSSGRSTGTHLHYEVWKDGQPVNPRNYFK